MWHCQRIGIRMALKPAFFTACIIFLVTTGLPQAVSAWIEPSGLPICIDSPSCPGAEHSNALPRFHPTTSLFHCWAVGMDSSTPSELPDESDVLASHEKHVKTPIKKRLNFKKFLFIFMFILLLFGFLNNCLTYLTESGCKDKEKELSEG